MTTVECRVLRNQMAPTALDLLHSKTTQRKLWSPQCRQHSCTKHSFEGNIVESTQWTRSEMTGRNQSRPQSKGLLDVRLLHAPAVPITCRFFHKHNHLTGIPRPLRWKATPGKKQNKTRKFQLEKSWQQREKAYLRVTICFYRKKKLTWRMFSP